MFARRARSPFSQPEKKKKMRATLLEFLWGESTVPDGVSLCRHYKLIIIASDARDMYNVQNTRVRASHETTGAPGRRLKTFTIKLFTAGPAVARRINGLIKHAILPVMQSLSTCREKEGENPFVPRHHCALAYITPSVNHAAGLVPLPFLYARLHSILSHNR